MTVGTPRHVAVIGSALDQILMVRPGAAHTLPLVRNLVISQ
jgi:hypothetical protein